MRGTEGRFSTEDVAPRSLGHPDQRGVADRARHVPHGPSPERAARAATASASRSLPSRGPSKSLSVRWVEVSSGPCSTRGVASDAIRRVASDGSVPHEAGADLVTRSAPPRARRGERIRAGTSITSEASIDGPERSRATARRRRPRARRPRSSRCGRPARRRAGPTARRCPERPDRSRRWRTGPVGRAPPGRGSPARRPRRPRARRPVWPPGPRTPGRRRAGSRCRRGDQQRAAVTERSRRRRPS